MLAPGSEKNNFGTTGSPEFKILAQSHAANSYKIRRDSNRRATEPTKKYFHEMPSGNLENVLNDPVSSRNPQSIGNAPRSKTLIQEIQIEENFTVD